MWREELPEKCPPKDAIQPEGDLYYRLVNNKPASETDFHSQRELNPTTHYNASECIARALSVFSDISSAYNLKKLPRHRNKDIVALKLNIDSGLLKRTGRDKFHYSWWVLKKTEPLKLVVNYE